MKRLLNKICERGQYTTCFVDGIKNPFTGKWLVYWGDCSKQHDEDYAELKENASTKSADVKYLNCLKKKISIIAYLFYGMVRVFGREFK